MAEIDRIQETDDKEVLSQKRPAILRGHAFSTYARRGEGGSSKSVRHAYKGEGELTHLCTYAKKSFLSCFVVYGDNFHFCAKKHLL